MSKGYVYSQSGRLWTAYKTVAPATFAGSTAYTAGGVAPTLLLRKASGSKKTRPLRLDVSQTGTVAGGLITCVIKTDAIDRYSSSGNLWLLGNKHRNVGASDVTPEFTVYDGATATNETSATGHDPRTIFEGSIFQTVTSLGTNFVYDFDDEDWLGATGSVLIYFYATGTAPTLQGTLTVVEE